MNKKQFLYDMKNTQKAISNILNKTEEAFDEKKQKSYDELQKILDSIDSNAAKQRKAESRSIIKQFWGIGDIEINIPNIELRYINERDRDDFIKLEIENSVAPKMYERSDFCDGMWESYVDDTILTCSIFYNKQYAGYCSIKDIAGDMPEISIEILKTYHRKGIGYNALYAFLDTVKARTDISHFRIRIDPDNAASQRLFEKLGAKPNGISKFLLHNEDDIKQFEDENLNCINDTIISAAKKFNVEPRQLLSHVLEYKLSWE